MELFRAPATSLVFTPTAILALASVAAACKRYPQATTVLISCFYPEYGPLMSVKTHITNVYACSIHPQYLDNSCRMC